MVIENILFSMRVEAGEGCFWRFLCVGSIFGCGRVGSVWFDLFGGGIWFGFGDCWVVGGGIVAGCWYVGGATHP